MTTPARAPDSSVAAFYDLRGESILRAGRATFAARFHHPLGRASRQFIESVLPPAQEGAKLLDLCCGAGAFSIHPAKNGYQVFGVDISPKSITAAREEAKRNQVDQACHFEAGDAVAALRSATSVFDVITICGSLYYLDRQQVMPLIVGKLAYGGTFLCLETNGSNALMNLYRYLRNLFQRKRRDQQTLHCLLRRQEILEIPRHFDDTEIRYFDFLTLLTPLLRWNNRLAGYFYAFARRLDEFLLNRAGLNALAFKVVIVGKKSSTSVRKNGSASREKCPTQP